MQRFLLTCAIGLGLWSALLLYSQLMTPLTKAVEKPKQPPKMNAEVNAPVQLNPLVAQSLSDQEWLKTAKLQWQRSQQAFLYAGDVQPDENSDGSALRMAPFAMVWKDERFPDREPMTVVARSARVRFEKAVFDTSSRNSSDGNSFNLIGEDAGRIVGAALEGEVRITGPDHLVIEGRDFIFREETALLYSDYEVSFRYGPPERGQPVAVRGKSLDGLTVTFTPAPSSPMGADMPRVAEIPKTAQLRGRVLVDFVTQEKQQAVRTRVSSQGPFQYEFSSNTAIFVDRVLVTRPRPKNQRQELDCNWLALVFGKIAAEATPDGVIPAGAQGENGDADADSLLSDIELLTVRARAKESPNSLQRERMKLISTEHGLECKPDDLLYDARGQVLTLTDPDRVEVTRVVPQGEPEIGKRPIQKFEAPLIEIRHSNDTLEQISGLGGGRFSHRKDSQQKGVPELWAHWKDRIDLIPHPNQDITELTVRGTATIGQRDKMRFDAAVITAWMPPLEQLGGDLLGKNSKLPRNARPPDESPVRRVIASGNVAFAGPGVVGRQIQQVDIQIVSGQNIPVSRPKSRAREGGTNEQTSSADPNEIPLVFEAGRLDGVAVFDPGLEDLSLQELHGTDGVRLWREGVEPPKPGVDVPFEQQAIRVTAREFTATNSGGTRQVLTLLGVVDDKQVVREPVIARFGETSLEGPVIMIDREKNLATVLGQGLLRLPVEEDFTGTKLDVPELADIACLEKITFDGQRATFLGSVKASILTNVIRAEEMTATLNRRIDFSADRPETRGLAIESLHCQDKVRVEMYEYDPQKSLVEILKASLHDFDLNQKTGDFIGHGPGKIQDWRRSGTRRMLAQPRSAAQANRPADSNRNYPWEYVGIDFEDTLTGNSRQRWGSLHERVKLIYAPVKIANEIFVRNDLSSDEESAANAVWIGSDQLTFWITGEKGQPPIATIEALQNAQMEGQLFFAQAYSLKYEQASEMFTLRGKGQDDATLNVQRDKNSPFSKLPAQVIQFFPSRQEVLIDGAKTFSTIFGGSGTR